MKEKYKKTLKIAIPAVLESLVTVIITSIDTKMVSVLGKQSISAISFTTQPKLIFFSIFFALGTATSVFVAQAYGKKDKNEANRYFISVLRISTFLAVVLGVLLAVFARPVMALCNRQPDTIGLSVTFFRIVMGFMVFQSLSTIMNAALRGLGKTKVTLYSNIAMGAADILFNYLLIEGHLGCPRLEVAGDAIATVMGTVAASVISFIAIKKSDGFLSFKGFFAFGAAKDKAVLANIRSKAGSIVFENIFTRIGFLLSSIITSGLSSDKTAVYSVAMILLAYSFAFGDGIQNAVIALIGRSVGAKKYDEMRQYFRVGIVLGCVSSLALSAIYILGSNFFFGLFFRDAQSLTEGFQMSCIAAVLTFVQILRIVNIAVMRGMGEVKDPRRIATVCVLAVNPALSLLFTSVMGMEIWGIWLSSVITQVLWYIVSVIMCKKHIGRFTAKTEG